MTSRARLFANLINSTSAITVPVGTDAQRPETPTSGSLRYSTTSSSLEIYNGTAWVGVGGGGASVTSTSTAPVSPTNGDMWHNTTNNKLYVYYNAEWTAMKSGSIVSTNDVFTGNGSQVNFTLSSAPTNEDHTLVAVGGVVQEKSTYSISGTTLTLSEAPISGDSIEVMIFNAGVEESATATPKISNIQVTDSGGTVLDDTAVDIAGGYIKITGTGFASGCQVIVNNVPATSTTFVSSTVVRAQLPATAAGTYIVYLINSDGGAGIRVNGVTFSATPSWVTGSALQGNLDSALSLQLSATGASTFALQSGSTLPAGLTLSSGGLISGTVTGLVEETIYSFTVVASDAENQDSPRTFSITITVGDTYFNRTTLAINADVGNTFVTDASTNNFPITVAGDTKPSAFGPYNTNWSNFFDGSGDYLTVSATSTQLIQQSTLTSTSTFTVESWVYPIASSGTSNAGIVIGDMQATGSGNHWSFGLNNSNLITFYWYDGAQKTCSGSSVSLNTWSHIAVSISSGSIKLFINGVLQTLSGTTTLTNATGSFNAYSIGSYNSSSFTGYISNLRIVKQALYSTTFTPSTTALTAIANTSLLTCQSNRFIDNSTNAFTITKNGDTKVSAFGPFTETDATTGSAYFDGSGDYLTVPDSASFDLPGDFTVEFFAYATGSNVRRWFQLGDYRAGQNGLLIYSASFSSIVVYVNDSVIITGPTLVPYQWVHIACVRQGAGANNLKLYVNGSLAGQVTNTTSFTGVAGNGISLGAEYSPLAATFETYMSDFRLVKGTAVYTAAFTPPTAPLTAVSGTQLLTLQTRQPVNNHTFIDVSGNSNLITRTGNVSQGSFSPFSPAGWSNYFDGSGDYLTTSSTTLLDVASSTQSFTIEAWIYPTSIAASGAQNYRFTSILSKGVVYLSFGYTSTGVLRWYTYSGVENYINSASGVINANQWQHVAIVSNAGAITLYVNGISVATGTLVAPNGGTGVSPKIGHADTANASDALIGYISNLRTTTTAVYTSNFTPPIAALTAITNTSLLTCQSNRFIDNSTNNFTITKNGDVKVFNFSPFKSTANYSPAIHGGSAYFDGTGDYISIPSSVTTYTSGGSTTTNKDFTIEGFFYLNVLADGVLFARWPSYNTRGLSCSVGSTGTINFQCANVAASWLVSIASSAGVVKTGEWNHFAVTRAGTTYRLFLNGALIGSSSPTAFVISDETTNITIGGSLVSGYTIPFNGYISNVRFNTTQALYTTAFTPPTSILPNSSNTVLTLPFNNAAIVDASSRNVIETGGDAKIVTSLKKFGTGSVYLDGTGDHLSILSGDTQNFYLGSSGENFTIEMWLYTVSMSTQTLIIGNYNNWNSGYAGQWAIVGSAAGYLGWMSDTGNLAINDTVARLNQWVHLAVCRNGSTITMYVNGTSIGTQTTAQGYTSTTSTGLKIGGNVPSISNYNGYIDDLRFTKGYARYTANFTPPTSTFLVR